MPIEQRSRGQLGSPGPFLAEITNHLDPTYMGSVEVALLKGIPSSTINQSETYIVKYLSPFYGVTSIRHEGTNSSDFNDVQKSYGMWMVPPDVGTVVMVIFIDGDPNQGYWIGCVPDMFQNHMVPGIAASKQVNLTPEQRQKYNTDYLPVAEFHKSSQLLNSPNVDKIGKPVHPFAERLLAQGLLLDTVRGVTSSSARREAPSLVFGVSTPGPLDTSPGAKKGKIGYSGDVKGPVSRLGGSTFVMDDGDDNGQNELVRIRTRTGHQILLHNSQDLIYIANSKGSAWIELTSNGKIDIFSQDSISIHSEADFNFRADRDINIEAGRNIRVRAMKDMETNVTGHYFLVVDDNLKLAVKNDTDVSIGQNFKQSVGQNIHISSSDNFFATAGGDMELGALKTMKQGAGSSFHVGTSGNYFESAAKIHMNGPQAESPVTADPAELPPLLSTYSLPNRNTSVGWANGNLYQKGVANINSIMQRVPTHEPWNQHENVNPQQFSSSATDATLQSRASSGVSDNPAAGVQEPANQPEIVPGTCDPKFAKDINNSTSTAGIDALKNACKELGITSPIAIASVLGIAGGESLWKPIKESFNYSSTTRLLQVFPSVFKGDESLASQYVNKPVELPEFLYGYQSAKGKGLGNALPGDGSKYIGRGYIQLTGRANYQKYSKLLFDKGKVPSADIFVEDPDKLLDVSIGALAAVMYFIDRVKLSQNDPGYFEVACRAVGFNTPDIKAKKTGYYQCFLAQLSGGSVTSGSGGIVVDGSGNPIKTGP